MKSKQIILFAEVDEIKTAAKKPRKGGWKVYKAVTEDGIDMTELYTSLDDKGEWVAQCKLKDAYKGQSVMVSRHDKAGNIIGFRRKKIRFVKSLKPKTSAELEQLLTEETNERLVSEDLYIPDGSQSEFDMI